MFDKLKSKVGALVVVGALSGLGLGGCDVNHSCTLVAVHSGALLTLHLPPEADVVAPETATVCREPDCVTGTIPPLAPAGTIAPMSFSSNDVQGTLDGAAGGVRVLRIDWTVPNVNPADPRNAYMLDVIDSAGTTTGHLAGEVTYVESMPNGDGCGTVWNASLSD